MEKFLDELCNIISTYSDEADKLFNACTSVVQNEVDLIRRAELIEQLELATTKAPVLEQLSNALLDRLEQYELEAFPADPKEALRYLMKENKVKQRDLADVATQSIISEILNGKRRMTVNQIKGFAKYFNVPVTVFMREAREEA